MVSHTESNKVAIFYHQTMLLHEQHRPLARPEHPAWLHHETPLRISSIYEYLMGSSLAHQLSQVEITPTQCVMADGLITAWEPVERVHSLKHINKVYTDSLAIEEGENRYNFDDEYYQNRHTFTAAQVAVDATISAVNEVLDGSYSKAYAIVRPPGHHAHTELAEGFCFFNNVAIAAANCVTRQKRVMIVDWDIHQGDGTQNTFYDSDQVLLVSLHRRDEGKFYPFREDASSAYIGTGKGLGFNVNIAWDTDGSVVDEVLTENNTVANLGAHEYKLAFEQIVLPLAREYQPDIILISCGFDAGIGDPIGCSKLSPLMYCWMTHQLASICGKILVVQEGGYNTDFMKLHAYGVAKGLLTRQGEDLQASFGPATIADDAAGISAISDIDSARANAQAVKTVEAVKGYLKPYWKCFDD